ncbi:MULTISPECIES: ATPase [unclassified Thioalkalivibrio]|uniref:ATPase n=1 Tax=unclassified Thioalkalivibrio TaxID=2621013 RepID=UPI0009D9909C|nr:MULTISPECIES: ATPase [unclassified Thioalkalivibrio]
MATLTTEQAERLVDLLAPLIGVQGEVDGRMVELVEVLDEGPRGEPGIALMETGLDRPIQANQYGDPLSRHSLVRTLPLLSEVERDVHPVLRQLLPEDVLTDLRRALGN